MGRQWIKATKYEDKEYDRLVTEQIIGGLKDEGMINGIL